jgi:hypothetical protein
MDEVEEAAVLDEDGFGETGRAGSIDEISEIGGR